MADRIARVAGWLLARGVGRGDRIASLGKNTPAGLELTFAAAAVGAAHVVLNYRLSTSELRAVLSDAKARVLFRTEEHAGFSVDLPVVPIGDSTEYERIATQGDPAPATQNPDPDECFLQLYTSGTTGSPKGVMLTHRSMLSFCSAAAAAFPGLGPQSVVLVGMPLYHVAGSGYALLALAQGARVVLVPQIEPDTLLEIIETERVTDMFLAPSVYAMLLDSPTLASRDLSSLRRLSYGASPMPLPLLHRCLAAFPGDWYQAYGMTELSGMVTLLGPEDHRSPATPEILTSAGRTIAGAEIRISDADTGQQMPVGQPGEIQVRSAQCMLGYWRRPNETAVTVLPDGWLRTGDVGFVDDNGYVYIRDRLKDMIITGGENVYPIEVENVLTEHPDVADAAVVGLPDPLWGEAVTAVVVPQSGQSVHRDDLVAFCRARLAGYKCPKQIHLVDGLPRNATGKVLRRVLRESLGQAPAD
jgi:acyl-CoA synthetase (AMP-forming)/AMP-acid ligase II